MPRPIRPRATFFTLAAVLAFGCGRNATIAAPAEPPARIVLVTLDTLRPDHLASYGYARDTAPFLSELARRGVWFANAYSTSSHTAPAHASLFTSRYPFEHGALRNGEELAADVPTLAERLALRGYETAAFASVDFLAPIARGFEVFDGGGDTPGWNRSGRHTVERALEWVAKRPPDARFLLWVHLYDPHEWHSKSPEYREAVAEIRRESGANGAEHAKHLATTRGVDLMRFPLLFRDTFVPQRRMDFIQVIDEYDGRIRYTDHALAKLHGGITDRAGTGRTLWIVTSDHGEGLGSHDYLEHGRFLYEEQIRVPLVMAFSDGAHAGVRVTRLARLVDLLPTLLALAGETQTDAAWRGRSLAPLFTEPDAELPPALAFAERRPADQGRAKIGWEPGAMYSLQDLDWKYVLATEGRNELFHLRDDPRETRNLEAEGRPEAAPLAARIQELAALAQRAEAGRTTPVDETRFEEQLRALGYVE